MVRQKKELALDELLGSLWSDINASVYDKKKLMHAPTLSIQGESLSPRTVILRGFNEKLRQCFFHTDIRSEKIISIKRSQGAFLHAYDYHERLQLRITGSISLSYNNDITRFWWDNLSDFSKKIYCIEMNPGYTINHPRDITYTHDEAGSEQGYTNFSVLTFVIDKIECLILEPGVQLRSIHHWINGELTQHWLVP